MFLRLHAAHRRIVLDLVPPAPADVVALLDGRRADMAREGDSLEIALPEGPRAPASMLTLAAVPRLRHDAFPSVVGMGVRGVRVLT